MRKILLFSVFLFALSGKLFAQTSSAQSKFSIGITGGLPVGSASTGYAAALGADLKYSSPISENWAISVSGGYTNVLGKNFTQTFVFGSGEVTTISGKAANISVIPIKLGARYTANGSTGFFGEVGAGGAFVTQGGGVSFDYSPGIGYAFNPSVEAGVRYEGWVKSGTFSQIALRIAYTFQ